MKTQWFISALAPLLLSCLLSGCLVSKEPLITAANSDRPFKAHATLTFDAKPGSASIDLAEDNSYVLTDDHVIARLNFKKISNSIYAYSRRETDNEIARYVYGYVHFIDDTTIATHEPNCREFDADYARKLGVEIVKERDDDEFPECKFHSVEALEALLMNYINDPRNAEQIKKNESENMLHVAIK